MKTCSTYALVVAFAITLFSCQPAETKESDIAVTAQAEAADSLQQQRRPAPEFFVIPEELHRSRVWLCDDGISDIFHVKNDCPVFMTCRSTKRNVSLSRAIEDYGRYNCLTCSEELSYIFDEDEVRQR